MDIHDDGLQPLIDKIRQNRMLPVLWAEFDTGRLSVGDDRRRRELLVTANILYEDWQGHQHPAKFASASASEKVDKSISTTGPQGTYAEVSKRFNAARQALGYPHSRRWKVLSAVIFREVKLRDAGRDLCNQKDPGRARLAALGDVEAGLTELFNLYRYLYGLF